MDPTPEECEQIARSIAMSATLAPSERDRVIDLLEMLADRLREARGVTTRVNRTLADPCPTVHTPASIVEKPQVRASEPP